MSRFWAFVTVVGLLLIEPVIFAEDATVQPTSAISSRQCNVRLKMIKRIPVIRRVAWWASAPRFTSNDPLVRLLELSTVEERAIEFGRANDRKMDAPELQDFHASMQTFMGTASGRNYFNTIIIESRLDSVAALNKQKAMKEEPLSKDDDPQYLADLAERMMVVQQAEENAKIAHDEVEASRHQPWANTTAKQKKAQELRSEAKRLLKEVDDFAKSRYTLGDYFNSIMDELQVRMKKQPYERATLNMRFKRKSHIVMLAVLGFLLLKANNLLDLNVISPFLTAWLEPVISPVVKVAGPWGFKFWNRIFYVVGYSDEEMEEKIDKSKKIVAELENAVMTRDDIESDVMVFRKHWDQIWAFYKGTLDSQQRVGNIEETGVVSELKTVMSNASILYHHAQYYEDQLHMNIMMGAEDRERTEKNLALAKRQLSAALAYVEMVRLFYPYVTEHQRLTSDMIAEYGYDDLRKYVGDKMIVTAYLNTLKSVLKDARRLEIDSRMQQNFPKADPNKPIVIAGPSTQQPAGSMIPLPKDPLPPQAPAQRVSDSPKLAPEPLFLSPDLSRASADEPGAPAKFEFGPSDDFGPRIEESLQSPSSDSTPSAASK